MIVDALLSLVLGLLQPVVDALPNVGPIGATSGLGGFFGSLNQVVDLAGPLAFIGSLLLAVPLFLAFRIVVFLYRLIPGKLT